MSLHGGLSLQVFALCRLVPLLAVFLAFDGGGGGFGLLSHGDLLLGIVP